MFNNSKQKITAQDLNQMMPDLVKNMTDLLDSYGKTYDPISEKFLNISLEENAKSTVEPSIPR